MVEARLFRFYLNVVGYKEQAYFLFQLQLYEFYLNVVGYKVLIRNGYTKFLKVLSERSGI